MLVHLNEQKIIFFCVYTNRFRTKISHDNILIGYCNILKNTFFYEKNRILFLCFFSVASIKSLNYDCSISILQRCLMLLLKYFLP